MTLIATVYGIENERDVQIEGDDFEEALAILLTRYPNTIGFRKIEPDDLGESSE